MKPSRVVIAISLVGPFVWLFGSILFNQQSFGFRDSAYYYHPLFEWTASQWGAGRIPLWNPLDNCGTPLVADATSSVFYPGKLLFALPTSFNWRFKLYVLLHVALAATTAFSVARRWRASSQAATVCALSYAFGGYVLFQHCNVVFLVSAAWLPLAVLFADGMLVKRRVRCAIGLGVVLALMVLGGDPQTAYHAGLVAALYAVLLWQRERRVLKRVARQPASNGSSGRLVRSRPVLLTCAAIVGCLLAAVQILPSIGWSHASQRAMYESPRNVYESFAFLRDSDTEAVNRGMIGRPPPGSHHEHIYQFSVAPWRIAECVWPNASGQMYPINRRWTNVIPGEDRLWTPSLYVGLLPFLLGLTAIRIRRGKVRDRWLTWCVILAAIGSCGWYGIGWLVQEVQVGVLSSDPDSATIGEPVGGLYWLMVVFLPGYAQFRFPAKLLVVASLGLSLLAARGWDRATCKPPRMLAVLLVLVSTLSALALTLLLVAGNYWQAWMTHAPGDDIWGPLNAVGALRDLRVSAATSLSLSLLFLFSYWIARSSDRRFARIMPAVLLLLTAADIAIANRWMIAAVADGHVEQSTVGKVIASRLDSVNGRPRAYRGQPDRWVPAAWQSRSSNARITENYVWQRATLFPRHHLPPQVPYASSVGSIVPMDYVTFMAVSRIGGVGRPDGMAEPHPAILDALSVEYLLLPEGFRYPHHSPLDASLAGGPASDFLVWKNPHRFDRCWIVRDIEWLPPLDSRNPTDLATRTRQVLFPRGSVRDLRQTAVVETEQQPGKSLSRIKPSRTSNRERCEVLVETPGRVELRVKLDSPALIVLNDYCYPGWKATRTEASGQQREQLRIFRTNRIMRGVIVPRGEHGIVFEYRPRRFITGAVISGLAWLFLTSLAFVWGIKSGN